ncbi:MAG: sensor histidine kinase [Alphaproteobacteria bacterium]
MIRAFYFAFSFSLLWLTAQSVAAQTIELRAETQFAAVQDHIRYLYETDRQLSIEEARAASGSFQRQAKRGPHFGNAGPVAWMRLDVANTGPVDGEWLLATRLSEVRIFDVYVVRADGVKQVFSSSDHAAAAASFKRHDMVAAVFALTAGERGTLFIRFQGEAIARLPMAINSFEMAAGMRLVKYVTFFTIAASVGALAFYSCAIFLIIGGRAILYYAAVEVTIVLLLAQFYGILNIHLWPQTNAFHEFAPAILNGLNVIFTALFVRHFFRLMDRSPWADRAASGFIYMAAAYFVLTPLLYWAPGTLFVAVQYIPFILGVILWFVLPPLAVYATLQWRRSYWPFIPGWTSVLFSQIYWTLIILNLVPEPPFHPQYLGLNAIIQALFLASAIVLEVRQLRDDRLHGQLELNAALQQQLASANQNAAILRELAEQDRLVHAAGHDTRSILLGLRNYTAGLEQGADAANVSIAAQAITHLTNDLEAVLSTTIASAAHSGGENILALESVPLAQILSAVRLIHERAIRDKGLRFKVHGGGVELVTDRPLLARILGNLVENACKYTDRGGVVLAARLHGGDLRIQIWDTGPGVAPDILAALLDPRIGQLRASELGAGHGSGLQIAKMLAGRIGGAITACSRLGSGSCFELRLPVTGTPGTRQAGGAQRLWVLENSLDAAIRLQLMALDLGMSFKYLSPATQTVLFGQNGVNSADFVLIAENFGGPGHGLEVAQSLAARLPQTSIFFTTYDKGVDVRATLAKNAGIILYEPVTPEALRFALYSLKPSTSFME